MIHLLIFMLAIEKILLIEQIKSLKFKFYKKEMEKQFNK